MFVINKEEEDGEEEHLVKKNVFIGIEFLIKSTDEVDLRKVPKKNNKEESRRRDLRGKKRKSEEEDYSLSLSTRTRKETRE